MAIEKEIIAQQLRDKGLDEGLSNFLNFEDETAMGQYFEMQGKGQEGVIDLSKFKTVDELIDAANKGDLKLVQGALDKTRQDTANKYKTQTQEPPKPSDLPKEDPRLEAMQKQLAELLGKEQAKTQQEQVNTWASAKAKELGLDSTQAKRALRGLKSDATQEDVSAAIQAEFDYLKSIGVSINGVPDSGRQPTNQKSKIGSAWAEKQKARQKFNKNNS